MPTFIAARILSEAPHIRITPAFHQTPDASRSSPPSVAASRPRQIATAFADFCDLAMAVGTAQRGRKIVGIDEVWKYCSPRSIPEELSALVLEGRKFEVETVFFSRRPNLVNEAILGAATETIAFGLQEENGIEKLTRYGFNAEELQALPPFHFVAINDSAGELRGRVTV